MNTGEIDQFDKHIVNFQISELKILVTEIVKFQFINLKYVVSLICSSSPVRGLA